MATYKRRRASLYSRPSKRRKMFKKVRRVVKRRFRRAKRYPRSVAFKSLFPDRRLMTHRWTGTFAIGLATGNLTTFSPAIQVNNMYDPNDQVTGFSNVVPSMYNLMKNIYQKYCVLGAKVRCTIYPKTQINLAAATSGTTTYSASNAANCPVRFGIILDDDKTWSAGNYAELVGAKHHSYRDCDFSANSSRRVVLTQYFSAKKFWGEGKVDDSYGGFVGYAPTRQCWVQLYAQSLDTSSVPLQQSYNVMWDVTFRCLWTTPRDFPFGQGRVNPT